MATSGDYKDLDLVHWLAEMIKENLCPGLKLIDSAGKFTIPWKNEKSGGLKSGDANTLFIEAWAKHKNYELLNGEYANNLSKWKEKFRNSLNNWAKKGKNIRRLKEEDTDDYIVCEFNEMFLPNNFPLMTSQGEGHTSLDLGLSSGSFGQSDSPIELNGHFSMSEMHNNMYPSYIDFEHLADIPIPEPAVMADLSTTQEKASSEVVPVLNISIMYGVPQIHVDSLILKSNQPACRLFYPGCQNPGVQQYFIQNDDSILHYQLPLVGTLPEFNKEQKGNILKILDKMDRGLYLYYKSGNVYAERRDIINVFFISDLHQHFKLSRRKSRPDEPHLFKVFDYQNYCHRLGLYQAQQLSSPPISDIIFYFELPNLSHVEVCVTHIKAAEEMNTFLLKEPPTEISSSKEDELDHLISFLSEAARLDKGLPPGHPAMEAIQNDAIPWMVLNQGNRSATPIENGRQTDIPKPPEAPVLIIEVKCDVPSQIIGKRYIPESKTLCRIFSGDQEVLLPWDDFNVEHEEPMSLRSSVEESDFKYAPKINKILSKLQRGVHVKYDNGDVYVERRCSVDVYLTDGVSMSRLVTRRSFKDENDKFVKVFDYEQFKHSLEVFRQRPGVILPSLPSHEFKLTLGHEINSNNKYSNPMMKILFYISIYHIQAYQDLCAAVGYPNEACNPLQSMPDSIDRIVQFVKDMSACTDGNRS